MHLIPHSHDDVGWIETPEEYFYGKGGKVKTASVKLIYDTVIQELLKNANRTFTVAEMKYFKMYYTSLNKEEQSQIKKLIQSGQLEIVTGGWVINDEACPNYEDIISLMQMGHTFVKREFGVIPRVGWMLDAFGHSVANAALFSDFGFDSIIFSRVSDKTKGEWEQS